MPGVARSFINLARNLGRVGIGEERFNLLRSISPTLDADRYSPPAAFGFFATAAAAGAPNAWRIRIRAGPSSTIGPFFMQGLQLAPVSMFTWTIPNSRIPILTPLNISALGDSTTSQAEVNFLAAPPVAKPPLAIQPSIVQSGIVELPTFSNLTELNFEQVTLNQAFLMNFWWVERQIIE